MAFDSALPNSVDGTSHEEGKFLNRSYTGQACDPSSISTIASDASEISPGSPERRRHTFAGASGRRSSRTVAFNNDDGPQRKPRENYSSQPENQQPARGRELFRRSTTTVIKNSVANVVEEIQQRAADGGLGDQPETSLHLNALGKMSKGTLARIQKRMVKLSNNAKVNLKSTDPGSKDADEPDALTPTTPKSIALQHLHDLFNECGEDDMLAAWKGYAKSTGHGECFSLDKFDILGWLRATNLGADADDNEDLFGDSSEGDNEVIVGMPPPRRCRLGSEETTTHKPLRNQSRPRSSKSTISSNSTTASGGSSQTSTRDSLPQLSEHQDGASTEPCSPNVPCRPRRASACDSRKFSTSPVAGEERRRHSMEAPARHRSADIALSPRRMSGQSGVSSIAPTSLPTIPTLQELAEERSRKEKLLASLQELVYKSNPLARDSGISMAPFTSPSNRFRRRSHHDMTGSTN